MDKELLDFVSESVNTKIGRHLKDIEKLVLQGSWQGQNYEEIAEERGYTDKYLRQDVGPKLWKLLSETFGERVSKTNFRAALERHHRSATLDTKQSRSRPSNLSFQQLDPNSSNLEVVPEESSSEVPALANFEAGDINLRRDWGEAVDIPIFYGRHENLATIKQWIVTDLCRAVLLLGMGGIGKTSLSIKLAQQIQDGFEYVIWRSLRNAPPIKELLTELVNLLSNQQEIALPESLEQQVSRLLHHLQQQRCLILLDNVESILQGGVHAGSYIPEYEGYGYLFDQIGRIQHQSCLLLTSREKPKEIALLEGDVPRVRSLQLKGLTRFEGQEFFKAKGCYGTRDEELQEISEHYDGNPLALKMVASAVQELAEGDMTEVLPQLRQGRFQFDDINDILRRQWERLSTTEQQVMYWLAINREPVSLSELQADVVSEAVSQQLLAAVQSLGRRSLIERSGKHWTLQPVVMEYVTCHLVEEVSAEIVAQRYDLLRNYALLKAQSKDYVRQAQARFILRLVINRLSTTIGSPKKIEQCLKELLAKLQEEAPGQPGYVGGNILNLLCELKSDLSHLDCSHLAIWQAYLVEADLHGTNFARADLSRSVFTDTLSATLSVAFSPDGKLFATGNADGEIRVWQTSDGKKLLTCRGHTSWVSSVAFSPDGQTLASGSFDSSVKLWNLSTGECLKTFEGHKSWVWEVNFSLNGQRLASGSNDHTVRIWDVVFGESQVLLGHTNWVCSVAFSPDGCTLASSSDDHTIRLWDLETGATLHVLEHDHWVKSVTFSPDGQLVLSGSHDSSIRLWSASTGECLKILRGHDTYVLSVAFSPDGQSLASAGQDCTVRLWNIATGQCFKTLQGHPTGVWSVAFHPSGQILASGSNDSTVRLWDVETGRSLRTVQGYSAGVRSVVFSADGQALVSGGDDKTVKLWDIQSGVCIRTLKGHLSWVWSVAISSDGQMLASSSSDSTVRLWDADTRQCLKTLKSHTNIVMSVAFSPDGQTLASGGTDQDIFLWDVESGQRLKAFPRNGRIWSVAFSPDGQILACGSEDTIIRLWDIQSGGLIRTLQGHTSLVFSIAFSPDGQYLVSSSSDQTVKLWNINTGECLRTGFHTGGVWRVTFCSSGQYFVSASNDKTVKVWNPESGECLTTLHGHEGEVWSVAFMPHSSILASGSQDGTIKLWDISTGKLLKTLRDRRPYEQMNITGVTDITDAQKDTLRLLGAVEFEVS
ncbi:NB-ARC domain-containing protein [Trichocoleus sp. DQ-A3]|uniref:WD40 domain-containing protein n=1 Tax=Cyanophyceae TaxID=3028117 RepID=UPI001684125E|nr:NB-ARC domain-containing protein [Coleofasciculus sp. FACHB-125]MBD1903676.1 NACHT domain-containing protein [Coleofasciculus sp. FACHB-125]